MILSLILFALAAAIAFFHYTQGFFSSTISAILCAVAAMVSIGYHENLATFMVGTRFVEEADAISLCAIFAVTYIGLRFALDALVPGNIRLPVLVDKIGAGVMGLVAGLLSTGVLAVAAQTLPFGPDVGFYTRYATSDTHGSFMGAGQNQDVDMYDALQNPTLKPDDKSHLWLWQDDLVMSLAHKVSDGGSLASDEPLSAVHPDYLAELFGQRLGIQVGTHHAVVNDSTAPIAVSGVYFQPDLTQVDGELSTLRPQDQLALPPTLHPDDGQNLLIVRVVINGAKGVADDDRLFRFSPGSAPLVLGHDGDYADYFPVATLDRKGIAVAQRTDDFLFADTSGTRTVDLVYMVDTARAFPNGLKLPSGDAPVVTGKEVLGNLPTGAFLAVKRYGVVDLSGTNVKYGPPTNKDKMSLERKPDVAHEISQREAVELVGVEAAAKPNPGTAMGDTGLIFQDVSQSNQLPVAIDVRKPDTEGRAEFSNGVTGNWENRKWSTLSVSADTPMSLLSGDGTNAISEIYVDEREALVQVHCIITSTNVKKQWDWARRLSDFDANVSVPKNGDQAARLEAAWIKMTMKGKKGMPDDNYLLINVRNKNNVGTMLPINQPAGKPTSLEAWLVFSVPVGATLQDIRFAGTDVLENLGFKATGKAANP